MAKSFTLTCIDCGFALPPDSFGYLCPECNKRQIAGNPPKGVFITLYPYDEIRKQGKTCQLFALLKERRFIDLLPLKDPGNFPPLKIGETPVYQFQIKDPAAGPIRFFLKDDSQNPTFSFKDRASQLISAYAREKGLGVIVAASTGNAGSSLAGICAANGQKAVIMVPATAPVAKLVQIVMYGAIPIPVQGNYDTAFDLSIQATREFGWFNRNTAYNPFTIEGKKTAAFEIYEHLGDTLPDLVFVPVGDGVILSGLYKGFWDLCQLGIISGIPRIIAVQSENSDNLVRNLNSSRFEMKPAHTLADSISVDYPRNFFMAKQFLKEHNGGWMTVSDDEIGEAALVLARNTGVFAEPAAAAAMAGLLKFSRENPHFADLKMLVLSTGSGLKDIHTPIQRIRLPESVPPHLDAVRQLMNQNQAL